MHYDNQDNFFVQLVGRKTVLLFPPKAAELLIDADVRLEKRYYKTDGARETREEQETQGSPQVVSNYATFDWQSPKTADEKRRAEKLGRGIEVTVQAGEMLYIPFGWWHEVHGAPGTDGLCASVSHFYQPYYCRLGGKRNTRLGPLMVNPRYDSEGAAEVEGSRIVL